MRYLSNHLNLPSVVTYSSGNSIEFVYDAAGMKLRKIVKVGATVQYEQDYAGGLEYRKVGAAGSKRIEAIYHAEGRYYNLNVEINNTLSWRKEYTLKDHLGNARVTFTDKNANGIVDITNSAATSDIIQENHYYPFGLNYEGPWLMNDVARDNKYQYNGKEWNDDFGLNWCDYGARWYDAAIGRWNGIDPLADNYAKFSPYTFVFDNPIRFIDPDGMEPETVKPENDAALNVIKNTLTKEDAQFVQLDAQGNIDRDLINSRESESGNFASLKTLVNSKTVVEVSLASKFDSVDPDGNPNGEEMSYFPADEYSDKDVNGETMGGTSTGEEGFMGKTLFPDRNGIQNSPDNTIKVIVNEKLSDPARAEIYSHEANGHAYLYVISGGDRQRASHQTPATGQQEQNTELRQRIIFSKQETIKNMKTRN